ncbi:MAG: hypothetical protein KGQ59_01260 [Bdellovibrionales bacterium]|nr:hypothetical protein [Bdellovibrionales bacterium]
MFKRGGFVLGGAILLVLVGCSQNKGGGEEARFQKSGPNSTQWSDSKKYGKKEAESKYGRFELYTITDEYLKTRKAEITGKHLRSLNLQGEFGVDAYLLEGYELPNTVILAPKIMLRSSIKGTRPAVKRINGDWVELETQIALFDGTESQLYSGLGRKIYAENLKFRSPSKLLERIAGLLGGNPNFLSSLPCPESISIHDKLQGAFDVQIRTPMKSCPTNVFIPATVKFKKEEFEKFKAGFIRSGQSTVVAKFSLTTPITLSYGRFSIKSQPVFDAIEKAIKDSKKWINPEALTAALENVVTEIQRSVDQCIPQEPFAPLKDQIIETLFDTGTQPDCPDSLSVCYLLKNRPSDSEVLSLSLNREEFYGEKIAYESTSVLSDSLSERSAFLIKTDSQNLLEQPKEATINNALRTVSPGDIIEFSVQKARQTTYEFKEPVVRNISNMVCLAPYSECIDGNWICSNPNTEDYNCRQECTGGWKQQCIRGYGCGCAEMGPVCQGYSTICDQRRVCERLTAPERPTLPYRMDKQTPTAVDFAWECTSKTDSKCEPEHLQDQWQRITQFSHPFPVAELEQRNFSLKELELLLDGLKLKFSNNVVCNIRDLAPELISNTKFVIEFKNTEKCKPFDEMTSRPLHGPSLSVLSKVSFPRKFRCGELWENYLGERSYKCVLPNEEVLTQSSTLLEDTQAIKAGEPVGIWIPYFPRTEIEAQLRFVGGYFEAAPEGMSL